MSGRRAAPEDFEEAAGPLFKEMDRLFDALEFDPITSATPPETVRQIADVACAYGRPKGPTYRDALAAYFNARPNEWIGGLELATVSGMYAWRTRVSECRTQLGMNIQNRVRTLENGVKVSEYRVVTPSAAGDYDSEC